MVGGDAATLARARPVLVVIGERIFHMGGMGTGATMQLVDNLLTASERSPRWKPWRLA